MKLFAIDWNKHALSNDFPVDFAVNFSSARHLCGFYHQSLQQKKQTIYTESWIKITSSSTSWATVDQNHHFDHPTFKEICLRSSQRADGSRSVATLGHLLWSKIPCLSAASPHGTQFWSVFWLVLNHVLRSKKDFNKGRPTVYRLPKGHNSLSWSWLILICWICLIHQKIQYQHVPSKMFDILKLLWCFDLFFELDTKNPREPLASQVWTCSSLRRESLSQMGNCGMKRPSPRPPNVGETHPSPSSWFNLAKGKVASVSRIFWGKTRYFIEEDWWARPWFSLNSQRIFNIRTWVQRDVPSWMNPKPCRCMVKHEGYSDTPFVPIRQKFGSTCDFVPKLDDVVNCSPIYSNGLQGLTTRTVR